MAVFKRIETALTTGRSIVEQADRIADRAYAVIATINDVVREGPKVLRSVRGALESVIDFVGNAISLLRNNPAARGPWRLVMLIVAGILRGFQVVVQGIQAAVDAFISLLTTQAVKRLNELLKDVRAHLVRYFQVSDVVKDKVQFLISLAEFLEQQQALLERNFPALVSLVDNSHLREINRTLKDVEKMLREINAELDALDGYLTELRRIQNEVNAIVATVSSVFTAVNNVLGVFNDILQRIRNLISGIPFIGWLQDKMSELLDWALEELGIRAMLQRIGGALGELPFIKAVLDFLRAVKAKVQEIIASVTKAVREWLEQIANSEKLGGFLEALMETLSKFNLKKLKEWFLPAWAQLIIEKVGRLAGELEAASPGAPPPEPVALEIRAVADEAARFLKVIVMSPELPFNTQRQEEVIAGHEPLAAAIEAFDALDPAKSPASAQAKALVAVGEALEAIRARYLDVFQEVQHLGPRYFLGGARMLALGARQYPVLAGYAPVSVAIAPALDELTRRHAQED